MYRSNRKISATWKEFGCRPASELHEQESLDFALSERGPSRSGADCDPDLLPPNMSWICWGCKRSGLARASAGGGSGLVTFDDVKWLTFDLLGVVRSGSDCNPDPTDPPLETRTHDIFSQTCWGW